MRFFKIMHHFSQIFSGNIHIIWLIIITGSDHNLFCLIVLYFVIIVFGGNLELLINLLNSGYCFKSVYSLVLAFRDSTILSYSLISNRFLLFGDKSDVTYFKFFTGTKKHLMRWKLVNCIYNITFFND